ncbi:MBL fold metallo-hydrolase [Corynebacterium cystitidis]|uniref:Glyoxylase, beta-lactamase superfamily II n=1 Tax=Corynebacterium cystitidis DSM 20524 TaxID=1121357 RepID=A0A1H9U9V7_9CORY|nr:MBL fold metallo-hydrolase [Corynebacterium cystitidis]WJY81255.1 putative polyketide biosynthesis zinc-dependent hydrolase BaeB [Corynebacterium cystitidis DSM 20524]SES06255.1 Glyoxylase, beta-lactamase superfamily II [Corynebacterium cystitidis DSM 20524]SNV88911.1 Zn-dependent hydrolase [Corynebacterium cystitidis]
MEHPAYSQLRPVTNSAAVVLAPNPSYAALEGTNSWIVRDPEDEFSIVVDPGPGDEGHLNVLAAKGEKVGLILLTHRHYDHADGAQRFRQLTGAPVRAFDSRYCINGDPLTDGELITLDGVTPTVKVVHTPGHTADSVCFFVYTHDEDDAQLEGIITGDTIAGRHTTMISETDGDLGDYLASLEHLEQAGKNIALLPGHGPDADDLSAFARKYIDRRNFRLDQIRKIWAERGQDVDIKTLVDLMYDDVDPVLRGAAEQSTRVTLRWLQENEA